MVGSGIIVVNRGKLHANSVLYRIRNYLAGLTGPDFVILTGKLSRNGKGYDWLILVTAVQ